MRLAERLSQLEPRRQGLLLQLRAPRPTRPRSSSRARPGPAGTSWSSTAPFTGAPTARCRPPRRSQSRRRSRRWSPGFAPWLPSRDALRAAIDEHTAAVCSSRSRARPASTCSPRSCSRAARAACDEHGAALVFDEIQCGMGAPARSGPTSRPASSPTPSRPPRRSAAACRSARSSPARVWPTSSQPGDHGSTFAGGPVVAAAALAALDIIDDPACSRACASSALRLAAGLEQLPARRSRARPRSDARLRGRRLRARGRAPRAARAAPVVNATGPTTVQAAAAAHSSPRPTSIRTGAARRGPRRGRGSAERSRAGAAPVASSRRERLDPPRASLRRTASYEADPERCQARAAALLRRPRHERDAQVDPGLLRGRGRVPHRQPRPARRGLRGDRGQGPRARRARMPRRRRPRGVRARVRRCPRSRPTRSTAAAIRCSPRSGVR